MSGTQAARVRERPALSCACLMATVYRGRLLLRALGDGSWGQSIHVYNEGPMRSSSREIKGTDPPLHGPLSLPCGLLPRVNKKNPNIQRMLFAWLVSGITHTYSEAPTMCQVLCTELGIKRVIK